ncbi:polymerase [Mucor mucedo]|uniref:polymerase n=1 Tax=Mucor mucedo TaxID=29922 RepID=UPI0022208AE6|nr:polymerase [Mucor mucedo]KAI7890573.1 polymerase [Mucor mucedo]
MAEASGYPGVTKPLALVPPEKRDLALTDDLVRTLASCGAYENEERTKQRQDILTYLEKVAQRYISNICQRKKLSHDEYTHAGGKVLTYGSYHLGVHSTDADIDTLCVIPNLVTREEFFDEMSNFLRSNQRVHQLNVVKDSYVPVIKFKYDDISIDLVCARVNMPRVPDDIDVNDPAILYGLDDQSIRSLNGNRVSKDILRLVPNVETYRTSLRCIKLWATRKGIYSNVIGFLGGIAWALLVARICQLYPLACPSTIISKFFGILINWSWPSPVLLQKIEDYPNFSLKSWNSRTNPQDRMHKMPVITPSFPSMCSTHNVTASTFRIVLGEFKMASETVDRIMNGNAPWSSLFTNHTFFKNYNHYLQVVVSSDDPVRQLKWAGWIEAKLRQLVIKLETVPAMALVHPFFKGFDYKQNCQTAAEAFLATHGVDIDTFKHTPPSQPLEKTVYTKVFYIGLYIRISNISSEQSRTIDLVRPIAEFSHMVKHWQEFDERHMGIVIENLKRSQLPADVFPEKSQVPVSKRVKSNSPPPASTPSRPNSTPLPSTNNKKKMKMNDMPIVSSPAS